MAGIKVSAEFVKRFGKDVPHNVLLAVEGEAGNTMFLINSGQVTVFKNTPTGEKVLATLTEGSFFGEMAIVGLQDRRAASVRTTQPTNVIELDKEAFKILISKSPDIAMEVIRVITERLRDTNGKVSALQHKDEAARLATYLNHLAVDTGQAAPRGSPGYCFVFKDESVAATLGLKNAFVSDFLAKAKKARILGRNGDWIWVPYPQYLLPFSDFLLKYKT